MGQLLNQSEIDALLAAVEKSKLGVSDSELKSEPKGVEDKNIKPYDITKPDITLKGRMPLLSMIYERFCKQFRNSLSDLLQMMCDVTLVDSVGMRFSEFLNSLPLPACITLLTMPPLDGGGLLLFDTQFVFVLVDILCGGSSKSKYKVEGREFTPIELKLARRVVERAIHDLKEVWKPVYPVDFEIIRMEINPQLVSVVSPEETVLVVEFRLDVEGTFGKMTLVMPYFSLKPIRAILEKGYLREARQVSDHWRSFIEDEVMQSRTELKAVLGHSILSIRDIVDLKVGDVIQLDTWADGLIPLFIGGKLKFCVKPGKSGAYRAVRIEQRVLEH